MEEWGHLAFYYAFIGFFLVMGGMTAWSLWATVYNVFRWLHDNNKKY